MGAAKRKRVSMAERLARAEGCVYCANAGKAETMDHMPPIAIFTLRDRPSGLEFPSCARCNLGTSATDQVVALMSRINPDPSSEAEIAELRLCLKAVKNNVPGLLEEMEGSPEWRLEAAKRIGPGKHPLYTAGPLVSGHMERFAAKFGLAMHFELTGKPVPASGVVAARWYSNADVLENKFPQEAWQILSAPQTLRQGRKHVSDQFEYAYAVDDEGRFGMFLGTFRFSFAVLAFTSDDPERFAEAPPPIRRWRPGDLVSA
jgi:hypothetical protein